jgi:dCMP deaminase
VESNSANFRPAPILLYIPALHKGYIDLFLRYSPAARSLWIIGEDLAAEFFGLHTEIRALTPSLVRQMIDALNIFEEVTVFDCERAYRIGRSYTGEIITASEKISREVIEKYFPNAEVVVDTVFLRYDEKNVKSLKPVGFDRESLDPFDLEMMTLAANEGGKSSDWWRHVGAVFAKNRKVVSIAHNQPVPYEQMPYIFGNPRDFIQAGTQSEYSDVLHSEKASCLKAWRQGVLPDDADLYVTVFPCPDCSKFIAYSGIKRVFFASGHASLDGLTVLKSQGVELIYVPLRPATAF